MISLSNLKKQKHAQQTKCLGIKFFSQNPFSFFFVLNSPFLLFPSHLRSPPNKMYPKFAFLIRKTVVILDDNQTIKRSKYANNEQTIQQRCVQKVLYTKIIPAYETNFTN